YLARRDPARADQHLEMAEREVQRIADVAQQTLGFVREVSDAKTLNVASTLEEVLQLYLPKLTSRHIELQKEFQEDCEIRGFSGELHQLFSNLIVNAVDAMPEGGRLRVRVSKSHHPNGRRRDGVRSPRPYPGGAISEHGPAHLFEPFYTTKKDSGTGLGLWLS